MNGRYWPILGPLEIAMQNLGSNKFAHLFLPPYSPELNPIERVWKLTRRLATHNRYFEKIEQVAEAVEFQFNLWSRPNATLKRLCAII